MFIALFIIPNVLAIFEGFYGSNFLDPIALYRDSIFIRNLTHFVVFLFVFSRIAEFFVTKFYGKETGESKLPAAIGLILSISISVLMFNQNWTLEGLGYLGLVMILILALLMIYTLITKKDAPTFGWTIALIIITLILLPLLFPGFQGGLSSSFPSLSSLLFDIILPYGALILGIILLVWLIAKGADFTLHFKKGDGSGGNSGGSGPSGGGGSGSGSPDGSTKGENIGVKILIYPESPKNRYLVGSKINCIAEISRRFWSRGGRNFIFTWHVNNIEQTGKNNQNFELTIGQDLVSTSEEVVKISVLVVDKNNPNTKEYVEREIIVVSDMPDISVTNEGNVIELAQDDTTPIKFEYHVTGRTPNDLTSINWFIVPGAIRTIDDSVLGKAIKQVNHVGNLELSRTFDIPFGTVPLDLTAGMYTIVAVGLTKGRLSSAKVWTSGANKKIMAGAFFLKVNPPSGKKSKVDVKLNIFDAKKSPLGSIDKDDNIDINPSETTYLEAVSIGESIANFVVTYSVNKIGSGDKFKGMKHVGVLKSASNDEKEISCSFSKGGSIVKVITVKLKVKGAAPSSGSLEFEVVETSTGKKTTIKTDGAVITLNLGENYKIYPICVGAKDFECRHKDPADKTINSSLSASKGINIRVIYSTPSRRDFKCVALDGLKVIDTKTIILEVSAAAPSVPDLKIVKVNGTNVKTGDKVPILFDKEVVFEALINNTSLIDEYVWYIQESTGLTLLGVTKFNELRPTFDRTKYSSKLYAIIVSGTKGGSKLKDTAGKDIFDRIFVKPTGFVLPNIFKKEIDDLRKIIREQYKRLLLIQKDVASMSSSGSIDKPKVSNIKNNAKKFSDLEKDLRALLTDISSKAATLSDPMLKTAVEKYVKDLGRNKLDYFANSISNHLEGKGPGASKVPAKAIASAEKVINSGLLDKSAGMFMSRTKAAYELDYS